jgi:hypothetical protein
MRDIRWLQIEVREDVVTAAPRERTELKWNRSRGSDKTWKSEMLMTTELVINWSPGDLVQSFPVLRKLERLSDGDGNKSYLVFYILYRIFRLISVRSALRKVATWSTVSAPSCSQSGQEVNEIKYLCIHSFRILHRDTGWLLSDVTGLRGVIWKE